MWVTQPDEQAYGEDQKTEQQWRQELDPAAYEVLRHQATERPFTGKYVNEKGDGVYRCAGCGNALFNSDTKFESGSGWPSFTDPMFGEAVETRTDSSHGMVRTEVDVRRAAAATSATCSTTGPATAGCATASTAARWTSTPTATSRRTAARSAQADRPSSRRVHPGLCATSHGWPSGSTKIPE